MKLQTKYNIGSTLFLPVQEWDNEWYVSCVRVERIELRITSTTNIEEYYVVSQVKSAKIPKKLGSAVVFSRKKLQTVPDFVLRDALIQDLWKAHAKVIAAREQEEREILHRKIDDTVKAIKYCQEDYEELPGKIEKLKQQLKREEAKLKKLVKEKENEH